MAQARKRIDTVRVLIVTGRRGTEDAVRLRVNGVDHDVHRISGGTDAGETYEGESFVATELQSCALVGPSTGSWDIRSLEAELLHSEGGRTVRRQGPVTLETNGELDVLAGRASSSFEG